MVRELTNQNLTGELPKELSSLTKLYNLYVATLTLSNNLCFKGIWMAISLQELFLLSYQH